MTVIDIMHWRPPKTHEGIGNCKMNCCHAIYQMPDQILIFTVQFACRIANDDPEIEGVVILVHQKNNGIP